MGIEGLWKAVKVEFRMKIRVYFFFMDGGSFSSFLFKKKKIKKFEKHAPSKVKIGKHNV